MTAQDAVASAVDARVDALARHWGVDGTIDALASQLDADPSPHRVWTLLASLGAEIPSRRAFRKILRQVAVEGGGAVALELHHAANELDGARATRVIRLLSDATLVDVHDTLATARTSGIQRVVRETTRRWRDAGHDMRLVRWTADGRGLRDVLPEEAEALDAPRDILAASDPSQVLIPDSGSFAAMELVAEPWRARRLEGLGVNPGLRVVALGYDCVPLTSAETASSGIARQFPMYLHALASAQRVVAISDAAATEFHGWARMARSYLGTAPEVSAVGLAAEMAPPSADDLREAERALGVRARRPLVLVVGSHEPRKNHLAVLQAARELWDDGLDFQLGFIGATSWDSDRFHREVEELQRKRRPVTVLTAASDRLLAAAYSIATVTVFPSLHEGFGLPVAESLVLGTPVVTSGFGSMKQIVDAGGGGVLVDPRDDHSIADGIRSVLVDADLRARLEREARAREPRRWDDYADELWKAMFD